MKNTTLTTLLCLALGLIGAPVKAQSDTYPSKPVRIIVGFPPGGSGNPVVEEPPTGPAPGIT